LRFPCRFLDHDAFVFGFVVPVLVLLVVVVVYLARSAVVARFTVSMQVDRRAREKMARKRYLQLFLFLKVTVLIATVTGLGAVAKLAGKSTTDPTLYTFRIFQGQERAQLSMLVLYVHKMHKIRISIALQGRILSKPSFKHKTYFLLNLSLCLNTATRRRIRDAEVNFHAFYTLELYESD
jgi:hypothetical protein